MAVVYDKYGQGQSVYGDPLTNTVFGPNYSNPQSWSTPVYPSSSPTSGSVLGASTGPSYPTQTTPTGDTTAQTQTQGTEPNMTQMINDIFAPTMQYLAEAESTIRQQQPGVEQELQQQYQTSKESLQGEKASGERQLAEQGQGAFKRKEDAASAARRLYGELSAGGRQRFGGATSAGGAYSELIGSQLQRGLGQVQSGYNEAMMKIDNAGQDLQMRYTTALSELENQKNAAINEAKRYFDDKLLEITRMRGETESAKASANLSLLQELRNTVYAINMQDYQYQQQLALNYQTNQQQVEAAKQRLLQSVGMGAGAYQNYLSGTTVRPSTQLAFGGNLNAANQPSYVGSISRKEDEYPYNT